MTEIGGMSHQGDDLAMFENANDCTAFSEFARERPVSSCLCLSTGPSWQSERGGAPFGMDGWMDGGVN